MMKSVIFFVFALVFSSHMAFADQCAWLDAGDQQYVFNSAEKLLKSQKDFVNYCANCNDLHPGKVEQADTVTVAAPSMAGTTESAYRSVSINGASIDLAYVYVRTGSRVFTNLALLVGCPTTGVPPLLYTAPGKSPSPVSFDDLTAARKPASAKKK